MTVGTQATTGTTNIKDLVVNSKKNCYHLFSERMNEIQNTGVSTQLEPGIHVVRIRKGSFDYVKGDVIKGEPIVMLWIYGGKFKNLKTNVEVPAGWSTLNGYDDTLTLAVLETSTLCAFFFDVEVGDNDGDVTISAIKVGELNDLN
ncbi:MAG: hypothetical protein RM338_15455 [Nostoc sp. DedQUE12a]|nr:hypothetical protein [Nostoc sp. DedQUE12a]